MDRPERLPQAPVEHVIPAPRRGFVSRVSASVVGLISMRLGAGRVRVDSTIDHRVGLNIHRKTGDAVEIGDPLATVLAADRQTAEQAASEYLAEAVQIDDQPVLVPDLIIARLVAN